MGIRMHGLVAAAHTPFGADGELSLAVVERQVEHLLRGGVETVFVGGSTGECHSLTLDERVALARRWIEATSGAGLRVVIHVGANCLADARRMAGQAESLGAKAIAAFSPSYYKPGSLDVLVACCAHIAAAAPTLPFYFYDIPALTGVHFSMPDFLECAGERVPTLAGIKFTNPDLMAYQRCIHVADGRFDIPWGVDEYLLAALTLGATGAVGSSFNFAAPVYQRMLAAHARGDAEEARAAQYCGVRLIHTLSRYGYLPAAKAVMGWLGVPVGPTRLPNANLTGEQQRTLRTELDELGFFDWIA